MPLPIPTVHLNGTGRKGLTKQCELVYTKTQELIEAMSDASPHGRDYYPQGDDAFNEAYNAHLELRSLVARVQSEFLTLGVAIQKAGK